MGEFSPIGGVAPVVTTETPPSETESSSSRFVYQADADQPLSEAVIAAIGTHSDVDGPLAVADEFGPLYDVIDPAALDSLFESTPTQERSDGSVSFDYAGRHVTVDTTGRVELVTADETDRPEEFLSQ